MASVAYIDPGKFATNMQRGAEFGYTLLWVLLWSRSRCWSHSGRAAASIEQAHESLKPLLGNLSATASAWAPLFSGLSWSTVGAMAVIASGLDPPKIVVLSQALLSFAPPFALVPLILLTRHKDLTGDLVNHQRTHWMAHLPAGIVLALNGLLLYQTFRGSF